MLAATPGLAANTVGDYNLSCAGEAGLVESVLEADFRLRRIPGYLQIAREVYQ